MGSSLNLWGLTVALCYEGGADPVSESTAPTISPYTHKYPLEEVSNPMTVSLRKFICLIKDMIFLKRSNLDEGLEAIPTLSLRMPAALT